MTETTQADFTKSLRAATDRLWMHRQALSRIAVRIGFWPDGLVISANITARNNDELQASLGPRVIAWAEIATLSEPRLVEIVDEICAPLYAALGRTPGEADKATTALVILGRSNPRQVLAVTGYTAAEMGLPLVELGGGLDSLQHLAPDRADEVADALKRAARIARGEAA